ncbi:MAG TPA: hypothetical protein VG498_21165 [Terriglobales bacterium]|nr:hypothetical protein [Terriglobales bacterium]
MFKRSLIRLGIFLSAAFAGVVIAAGCGGGNQQTSSSGNGNPTAPAASNPGGSGSSGGSGSTNSGGSGSSGGSGGGTSGGSGGGTVAYYFEDLLSTADSSNHGAISLNSTGSGTVQLNGAAAGTSYSIQFCPFPNGESNCFSVGSSDTDASGNAKTSFTFSRSGTWAGIFLLQPNGGSTGFASSFSMPPATRADYQSPLQQAKSVTSGTPSFLGPPGSDPLMSGFVTINGTNTHFTLTGAPANVQYVVGFCGNGGGSSCFADLGTVTTDASGNGFGDVNNGGRNIPGVFYLGRNGVLQYIEGIHIP